MDNKKEIIRAKEWQSIMEEYKKFFYADDGLFIASLIDNELERYNWDFDRITELIQKLKDFETKYGELHIEEKETLLEWKETLLDLKTPTNKITEYYRKMSNIYESIY